MNKTNETAAKICDIIKNLLENDAIKANGLIGNAYLQTKREITEIIEAENKEKKLYATDIEWDNNESADDLPTTVEIPEDAIDEIIGDYLSDEYGFCHKGFSITIM